jgi:hypothetical protein
MATGQTSPKIGKVIDVPAEPTIGTATVGAESASVTFTANTSGKGGTPSSYVITSNPGSVTATGTTSPIIISGLTASTAYTFTASGVGVSGQGYPSDASNSVTPTVAVMWAQGIYSSGTTFLSSNRMNNYTDGSGSIYNWSPIGSGNSLSVTKMTATGLAWQTLISVGTQPTGTGALVADTSGNVYVTTGYDGGIFVFKLSSTGTLTWQKKYVQANLDGNGIAVDTSGNVIITGQQFNGANYDGLIVKYNSAGTLQWANKLASNSPATYDYLYGPSTDSSGNIYTGGFSFITTPNNMLTKYNSSGTLQWQRKINGNGTGSHPIYSTAVDSSSNIYATGYCSTTAGNAWFIAKWNSSGTIQWQNKITTSGYSSLGTELAIDSSGNVYTYGYVNQASASYYTIVKVNSSGTIQWQRTLNNSDFSSYPTGISTDGTYVYLTMNANNNTYILNIKLLADGTGTGTFVFGGKTYTYASSSWTYGTGGFTESAQSFTASSVSGPTDSAGTGTTSTPTYSTVKVGIA